MIKQKKLWDNILTVIMALLCLLWIYPIVLILLNSLKKEGTFTTSTVFQLPTRETFAGLSNYVYGVIKMGFLSSLGYSLVITVSSVALILLCCSMTGWYLTRVNNKLSKFMNLLIVFSMVVPFQMVMFTLSKTADTLKLNTPWNICIIYLGFGAGLAVFMFTGFMKSVPMEIEEAAMIDGCNEVGIFFRIVMPLSRGMIAAVTLFIAVINRNDYYSYMMFIGNKTKLQPFAWVLHRMLTDKSLMNQVRNGAASLGFTLPPPMAVRMATIICATLPIIIIYPFIQPYFTQGMTLGAVKE